MQVLRSINIDVEILDSWLSSPKHKISGDETPNAARPWVCSAEGAGATVLPAAGTRTCREERAVPLPQREAHQRSQHQRLHICRGGKEAIWKSERLKASKPNFISTAALRSSIYCSHSSVSREETMPCSWCVVFSLSLLSLENIYR